MSLNCRSRGSVRIGYSVEHVAAQAQSAQGRRDCVSRWQHVHRVCTQKEISIALQGEQGDTGTCTGAGENGGRAQEGGRVIAAVRVWKIESLLRSGFRCRPGVCGNAQPASPLSPVPPTGLRSELWLICALPTSPEFLSEFAWYPCLVHLNRLRVSRLYR